MTTGTHSPSPQAGRTTAPGRLDPMRTVALAGGIAYLVSFAASIPQLALFADLVADPAGFLRSPGGNTVVLWGSCLEIVTAAACIGTAVALYPITRRVSPTAAIGFVTSRVVEAALIFVGVVCVLTVVTLRADLAGATGSQAAALSVTGEALVAMRQWTFLLGPGLMAGINALFLGSVLYRARLVPRIIPTIGLLGAPLILTSATVTIFGGWDQLSTAGTLCALPVAVWELSLGIWLTVKGFTPTPLTPATTTDDTRRPHNEEPHVDHRRGLPWPIRLLGVDPLAARVAALRPRHRGSGGEDDSYVAGLQPSQRSHG